MNILSKSVANLTKCSMNITKHLLSKPEFKEKNVVFSPLSLQTVLSLFAAGSEDPTQHQLLSFLGSKSIGHLNSLFSHLASSVLKDAAPAGGPRLSSANAGNKATQIVNLWAKKETNGLIRNYLPPGFIGSLTSLILTNVLYLKGAWDQPFNASKTKNYFHIFNGSSVKVPFMTSKKKQFISAFEGFKVLRLPYKQGEDKRRFSMYFFLPDANDGLLPLIEKAASEPEFLEHNLPYRKVEVGDFIIPGFNISFELEISYVLNELGVVFPFSKGGLKKIADYPMWVSDILQKSFIEVNEEGTEAAAVTAIGFCGSCQHTSTPIPIDFVVDHPFLFLIREDLSGTILFVGQVHNPLVGRDGYGQRKSPLLVSFGLQETCFHSIL